MRNSKGQFMKGNIPHTKLYGHSEETKEKLKKTAFKKGHKPWSSGLSKETDERIKHYANERKGKSRSEETKRKISETHLNLYQNGYKHPRLGIKFVNKEYYSPYFNKRTRPKIIERDGNKCMICSKEGYLVIHHKKPLKSYGDHNYDNLILVCQRCHSLVHRGKIKGYLE